MRLTSIALILALFLPFLANAAPSSYTASVIGISDGDTITVLTADKRQVKIRLYGIDCPERSQPYGNSAKLATGGAVHGKNVEIRDMGTDRYGRAVGVVTMPGQNESLNAMLVKKGLAWVNSL
ncbi:MAG: thermonuclease family protein [Desulfovibrio sp.]|jgi:endonuclease YncB( thermonuclease family)|nr:thermonuclease family protein [Desulfovibrio sp.]